MPSPSRRRAVRALCAAGALGLLAFAASPAAPGVRAATEARSAVSGPVLLRDRQTGFDRLGSLTQPSTPTSFIQADTQVEPSIAVNPHNPNNVVVGYQEGRVDGGGDATNGWATSFDAGRTWTFGEVPGLTSYPGQTGPFDRASDAVVAFGPNNDVYYSSLVFNSTTGGANRSGMAINVSKDGGRTWSQPVFFDDDMLMGLNDKNWVVVDNSSALGHHKGRVYIVWDRVLTAVVYDYCDSACDTLAGWAFGGKFKTDLLPAYALEGIGSTPVVLNDGSLAVLFDAQAGGVPTGIAQDLTETLTNPTARSLACVVAQGAGLVPFGSPLVFGTPVTLAHNRSNGVRAQRAGSLPSADYDATRGTLWISWEDARFHTEATPVNDILVASSSDGGLIWSPPKKVNPSTAKDYVNRYNATIAVSADGVIHVAYRSRQEADHLKDFSPSIQTYYQQSTDGGATWSTPIQVSTVSDNNAYYGAFSRSGTFQGDYSAIASGGGLSYVVREESFPLYAGEPVALTPDPTNAEQLVLDKAGETHQHQRDWVAVLGPPEAVATPTPTATATTAPTTASPTPQPTPGLANTGTTRPSALAGAVALVAILVLPQLVRRRGRAARHRRS